MTVIARDLRPDVRADLDGFVEVRRLALPYMLFTPESVAHDIAHAQPEAALRRLVAEEDGEIIGTAQVGIAYDSPEPDRGFVNVYVHPERTRRGAGSLLARAAEEHLAAVGATRLYTWVLDEPANHGFAERFGYTASRSAYFLRLDLAHGALPRSRTRRRMSRSARAPTSPTTRAPCSSWTRRRWPTNPATSAPSSRTTRPGWTGPGNTLCSARS